MKKEITKNTLVDYPRLQKLLDYSQQTKNLSGFVAEVGVYKGGTAYLLAQANSDKNVYLFDTFEGMPEVIKGIDLHNKGDFKNTSLEQVKELLGEFANVSLHKGIFPKDTSEVIKDEKFRLVHIDADIYTSVKESLEFFYDKMVPGGIIVFDDYNAPSCPGAKKAVDEFLADKPEKLINFVQSQTAIIKL